jgi:Cobalamin-independent synthase, Catalytic domain
VGPPELLEARKRLERGEIRPPEFKRVGDAAVDAAIRLQESVGLAVVTDGEMRRLSFQSQFTEAVEGFSDWDLDAFRWGDWHGDEVGNKRIERPPIAVLDRLRRRRFLSAEEFTYTRGRTKRIVKVTLPSPSLLANFYDPQHSRGAYPTLESFLADVAEILREELDELVRLGCEYVQLDAPHYPLLLDPTYRDFYASRGWPSDPARRDRHTLIHNRGPCHEPGQRSARHAAANHKSPAQHYDQLKLRGIDPRTPHTPRPTTQPSTRPTRQLTDHTHALRTAACGGVAFELATSREHARGRRGSLRALLCER